MAALSVNSLNTAMKRQIVRICKLSKTQFNSVFYKKPTLNVKTQVNSKGMEKDMLC